MPVRDARDTTAYLLLLLLEEPSANVLHLIKVKPVEESAIIQCTVGIVVHPHLKRNVVPQDC